MSRFTISSLPSAALPLALCLAVALSLIGCANNAEQTAPATDVDNGAASAQTADDAATTLRIEGPSDETPLLTAWSFTGPVSSSSVTLRYDERGNLVEKTMTHQESSTSSTNTTVETYESDVPTTLTITDELPSGTTESLYTFDVPTLVTDAGVSTLTETALPDAANDYPTALQFEYAFSDDLAQLQRTVESSILLTGQKVDSAADIQIAPDNTIAQGYDYNADGTLATFTIEAYGEQGVTNCAYDGDSVTLTGDFAGEWTITRDGDGRIVGLTNEAVNATMSFTYETGSGLTAVNRAIALTRPAYAFAQGILEADSTTNEDETSADAA